MHAALSMALKMMLKKNGPGLTPVGVEPGPIRLL
jgi:hypothetical protein